MMLCFVDEVMNHRHKHVIYMVRYAISIFVPFSTAPSQMQPVVGIGMDLDMDLYDSGTPMMLGDYVRGHKSVLGYLSQMVLIQTFHVSFDLN